MLCTASLQSCRIPQVFPLAVQPGLIRRMYQPAQFAKNSFLCLPAEKTEPRKSKMFLILKFGGTSVGSAERFRKLVPLVNDDRPKIVVLSAMSGTTNALVDICDCLHRGDTATAAGLIASLR